MNYLERAVLNNLRRSTQSAGMTWGHAVILVLVSVATLAVLLGIFLTWRACDGQLVRGVVWYACIESPDLGGPNLPH